MFFVDYQTVYLVKCRRPNGDVDIFWASAEAIHHNFGCSTKVSNGDAICSIVEPEAVYAWIDIIREEQWHCLDVKCNIQSFIEKENIWGGFRAIELALSGRGFENIDGQVEASCNESNTLVDGYTRHLFRKKKYLDKCSEFVSAEFYRNRWASTAEKHQVGHTS